MLRAAQFFRVLPTITAQRWGNLVPCIFLDATDSGKSGFNDESRARFLGHTVTSLALTGYVTLDEPLGPFGSQFLTVDDADAETPSGMEVFVSRLSGFPAHKGRV